MLDVERVALEWKYLDGLSVQEIAARLARTEKAAEALLYRARRSFLRIFEKNHSPIAFRRTTHER